MAGIIRICRLMKVKVFLEYCRRGAIERCFKRIGRP